MQIGKLPEVRLNGVHCGMVIHKLANQVLLLTISGMDIGEFKNAPMQELSRFLAESGPSILFIDARRVKGASIDVSADWAKWMARQKGQLQEIHMLTGSRFVQITADFVRRFSNSQSTMRIYTEPTVFDDALGEALI